MKLNSVVVIPSLVVKINQQHDLYWTFENTIRNRCLFLIDAGTGITVVCAPFYFQSQIVIINFAFRSKPTKSESYRWWLQPCSICVDWYVCVRCRRKLHSVALCCWGQPYSIGLTKTLDSQYLLPYRAHVCQTGFSLGVHRSPLWAPRSWTRTPPVPPPSRAGARRARTADTSADTGSTNVGPTVGLLPTDPSHLIPVKHTWARYILSSILFIFYAGLPSNVGPTVRFKNITGSSQQFAIFTLSPDPCRY